MTTYEVKAARVGVPVGMLTMKDRSDALDGILKRIYALKGFTVADNVQPEIDIAVRELEDKLAHRWTSFTMGEVALALESGVSGFFGADNRLTIANYFSWLTKYERSDERSDAIYELAKLKKATRVVDPQRLLPPEEQAARNERAGREAALCEWERFKKCGRLDICIDGYAAMIYDYLTRKGKLNATEATISQAYRQAKTRHTDKQTYRIGDVIKTFNPATAPASELLDWATKRELLSMYYESLRRRGVELQI